MGQYPQNVKTSTYAERFVAIGKLFDDRLTSRGEKPKYQAVTSQLCGK